MQREAVRKAKANCSCHSVSEITSLNLAVFRKSVWVGDTTSDELSCTDTTEVEQTNTWSIAAMQREVLAVTLFEYSDQAK